MVCRHGVDVSTDRRACFACWVGVGTLGPSVSRSATPSRNLDRMGRQKMRPMREPSWEKGIAGEHRPGGGFMPYLTERGTEMGVKEFGERRREVTAIRNRQRSSSPQ